MVEQAHATRVASPVHQRPLMIHGRPLQITLGSAALLALLGVGLGAIQASPGLAVGQLGLVVAVIGAAVQSWRTAQSTELSRRTRRAWALLALATTGDGVGRLAWLGHDLLGGGALLAGIGHIGSLIFYPLWLMAILGLVSWPRQRIGWLTFVLDLSAHLLATIMLFVYVATSLGGWVQRMGTVPPSLAIAYTAGALIVQIGAVLLLLRWPETPARWSIWPLVLSAFLLVGTDLGSSMGLLRATPWWMSLQVVIWTGVFCLIALAASRQRVGAVDSSGQGLAYGQRLRLTTLTPYLAVAVGTTLLILAGREGGQEPLVSLIACLVILIGLVIVRQVTALKETIRLMDQEVLSLRRSEERFRSLVQSTSDVLAVVDADGIIRYLTPSIEALVGFGPGDLIKTRLSDLLHPDDLSRAVSLLRRTISRPGVTPTAEWRVRHAGGDWRVIEVIGNNVLHDPNLRGVVLTLRDISDRKALEEQLAHQALHDRLTGLVNRGLFQAHLDHALHRQTRLGQQLAVLCIGLDNLKTVTDSLGHSASDTIRISVARTLQANVGTSDTVARISGDEFAILLEDMGELTSATTLSERLAAALAEPLSIDDLPVALTVSIGIATATDAQLSADDLLRNADVAMNHARRQRGGSVIFEESMHRALRERLDLEAGLRQAIEREEFALFYQPTVDLRTGRITGLEALMRWIHPERGLIPPGKFIPLAEENGLILQLGRWALRQACQQAQIWRQEHPYQPPLTMSVNLSPRQIRYEGIVDDVAEALRVTGLEPRYLILEITETTLGLNIEAAQERLEQLKALGVQLAIDDFGTGYSSLSYLQRFPVDILKIDRAFIDGIATNAEQTALTRGIIALGRTLNLRTVAEGIEHLDQLKQLRRLACDLGQGYFFGRPLDASQISVVLARRP